MLERSIPMKKNCLFKMTILSVILFIFLVVAACGGSGGDGGAAAALPFNDNFNSYTTTFPAPPWSVYLGTNGSNWTTNSGGGDSWTYYNPFPATTESALVYDNYISSADCTITARMQVIDPSNKVFGLFLRASGTGNSDAANYEAMFSITSGIYIMKRVGLASYGLSGPPSPWPTGFDPGTQYNNYKFSISGSGTGTVTLTASIEGVPSSTVTCTDDGTSGGAILTTGKTGFDFNLVSEGFITNFQVTEP
jgi:hypothetical protein